MSAITFVLPNGCDLGGVTVWSVQMAQQLRARGSDPRVIVHIPPQGESVCQMPEKVSYRMCPGLHPFHITDPHAVSAYLPVYRAACPCVFIPNWANGTYAACARISQRTPKQLRVIGFAHSDERECYATVTYYAPLIHQFVAVSDEIASELRQRLPTRANDIVVRPYAVESPAHFQRYYTQPGEPLKLVYAARLQHRQKRVFDLVSLVELLGQRRVNFTLQVIGEGEDEHELRARFSQLAPDIARRIVFTGRLPHEQMPRIWTESDICLLVSEYEGTSITMLEAMAHGCIPVVTKVSGTARVITPGENGYVVNVGDLSGMAAILEQLAALRLQLPAWGAAAYCTIQHSFSYQDYLDWFVTLTQQVWTLPPRCWPRRRPLLPCEPQSFRQRLRHLYTRIRQR
jgi:glycosyltransferase involved in cell wall biosynthesis